MGGSPHRGFKKYLSRFDDAMTLRGQLANEKPQQDGGSDSEDLDPFRVFRLVGSILLAVFVRVFVCRYLVSGVALSSFLQWVVVNLYRHVLLWFQSIFAPFLTLELAYMGLSKYFPKVNTD